MERAFPEFDSRLIGAVQFARSGAAINKGAPLQLATAAAGEAESLAKHRSFLSVIDPRGCARAALAAIAATALLGLWALLESSTFPTRVARAFGADVALPRETKIVDAPGEALVGIGDRVELAFGAEGVLPDQGELSIRYASGRRETAPLSKDASAPGRYLAAIEDVPESFTFLAEINDASTEPVEITALERPAVETISAIQTYPEFTGLEPTAHQPGDFALLPGSTVALTLGTSGPLSEAKLAFVSGAPRPRARDRRPGGKRRVRRPRRSARRVHRLATRRERARIDRRYGLPRDPPRRSATRDPHHLPPAC